MAETKTAATSPTAAPPRVVTTAQTARPRKDSRGWLALFLQVFGFAGAATVGFAASHYFTLQQQAAAERQKLTSEEQKAAAVTAAKPVPEATDVPADSPATEAAAPEQRFPEDVERAEMIEAGQSAPALLEPTEQPALNSAEGLPFDELEPAPSDLKVETFDGTPVENFEEPATP